MANSSDRATWPEGRRVASRAAFEESVRLELSDSRAIRPRVSDMAVEPQCMEDAEDEPHNDIEGHGVAKQRKGLGANGPC